MAFNKKAILALKKLALLDYIGCRILISSLFSAPFAENLD
jgi:hypothetical protein